MHGVKTKMPSTSRLYQFHPTRNHRLPHQKEDIGRSAPIDDAGLRPNTNVIGIGIDHLKKNHVIVFM